MPDLLIEWISWVGRRWLTKLDTWMKIGENTKSRNSEKGKDSVQFTSVTCHVQLFVITWTTAARPPCPSPTPRVHPNSCQSSQWCHPTISFLLFYYYYYVASVVSNSLRPHESQQPGLPVHHQLPEFTQTHIHRVSDAIQPSHPLSSPSPAPNPSQHQSLCQWVNSLHEVAKVLEFQL